MKKNLKNIMLFLSIGLIIGLIFAFYWHQEYKYYLPTPIPKNYKKISLDTAININIDKYTDDKKITLLNFYNPDCPCSKFNFKHLTKLLNLYKNKINFVLVLQSDENKFNLAKIKNKFDSEISVILDTNSTIAQKCGVYSTPQAAILTSDKKLYFRGNYNKTRYCTDTKSEFVKIAIDSLLNNHQYPKFTQEATISYGCELPENEND